MTKQDYRKQFITWLKRSSWHPCWLDYLLEQQESQIYNPFAMMTVQQQIKANKAIAVLRRDRGLKKSAELGIALF